MENNSNNYRDCIQKFLNEFMADMYKGKDHIIARKYFDDLFSKLLPKYFIARTDCNTTGDQIEITEG